MSKLNLFIPITKYDAVEGIVYGRATEEKVDSSNEIMDYESSKPLFEAWSQEFSKATDGKSLGNVRSMHGKQTNAAGKLIALDLNDLEKAVDIGAKIVDPVDRDKLEEGIYTGFSVGGSYEKIWNDPHLPGVKRYTAKPGEISLVDRPMLKTARFTLVKADGLTEDREFASTSSESSEEELFMKHTAATVLAISKVYGIEDGHCGGACNCGL